MSQLITYVDRPDHSVLLDDEPNNAIMRSAAASRRIRGAMAKLTQTDRDVLLIALCPKESSVADPVRSRCAVVLHGRRLSLGHLVLCLAGRSALSIPSQVGWATRCGKRIAELLEVAVQLVTGALRCLHVLLQDMG